MHVLAFTSLEEPYEEERQGRQDTDEIVEKNPAETDLFSGVDSPKGFSRIAVLVQYRQLLGKESERFAGMSLARSSATKPTKIRQTLRPHCIEAPEEFMLWDGRDIIHWLGIVLIVSVLDGRKLVLLHWGV